MRTLTSILVILLFSGVVYAQGSLETMLSKQTWTFGKEELSLLNNAARPEMEPLLIDLEVKATHMPVDRGSTRLIAYSFIDLNKDGLAELLTRFSRGALGRSCDVMVVTRRAGKYFESSYEDCGDNGLSQSGFKMYETKDKTLVIGGTQVLSLHMTDPTVSFPVIYGWNGERLIEVSREHRAWYQGNYVPVI